MISATMFEAKTRLSELVKRAQAGEEVVITSGRSKTPVARIQPIAEPTVQRFGAWANPKFTLTEAFWEETSEEESGLGKDDLV